MQQIFFVYMYIQIYIMWLFCLKANCKKHMFVTKCSNASIFRNSDEHQKNKRNHHYQIVSQCLLKRFTFPHWYSKKKHVCARTRGQGVSGQENSSMMFFTKFLAFKTVFQLPLFQTQYVHHVTLIPPFSNHV